MVTSDLGTHTFLSTFPQLHSFLLAFSQPSASSLSSRSPSRRTVALTMNASQTWCFELIWTSGAPGGMGVNWPNQGDPSQIGRGLKGAGGLFLA